jgi:hypothetical protein
MRERRNASAHRHGTPVPGRRPCQPPAALHPNRSLAGGLLCKRRCSAAWISFLRLVRARTSCSRRASRRRNTPGALIRHPHRLKLALPKQARQSARVQPIGLRARLRDPGPRSERSRPRRSRSRRSHGEHPDRSHGPPTSTTTRLTFPSSTTTAGEAAGQRHRPPRARSSIQASRWGGRTKSPGSKPIAKITAYPSAYSQEGPCPGSTDATAGAGQTLQEAFSCRERRAEPTAYPG